nr:hypothetical protein [Tanacetum cinerariifolium]
MNGETCQYGDKCHFTHGFAKSGSNSNSNRTSVVNVLNGDELREFRKTHMTWKTRLCHKWVASGSCPYGANRLYAHGVLGIGIGIALRSSLQICYRHNKSSVNVLAECLFLLYIEMQKGSNEWRVKTCEENMEFLCKNGGKISRVYADWIDDTPLDV